MTTTDRTVIAAVLRSRWRGAAAEGLLVALVVSTSAFGYAATYRQPQERTALQATLGDNAGMAALFGGPHTLATLGGFTAWRSVGIVLVFGSIWGALLGARLFRGEEEEGRLELVLAGRTTRRRGAAATMLGAVVVLAISTAVTALGVLVGSAAGDGWSVGGTVLLTCVLAAPAALFVSVGALTSQVFVTRRAAALGAGAAFGVVFVERMCVGALRGQRLLGDLDPLVWLDRSSPLVAPQLWWLAAVWAITAACAGAAVLLAGRRDLGGVVPERAGRVSRPGRRVDTAGRLAWRSAAAGAVGWWAGLGAAAAVVGMLAQPVADAAGQSADMRRVFAQLTGTSASGARTFAGLAMVMLSLVVCLTAAAAVVSLRDEESAGRLELLVALPLSRRSWLAGRVGAAVGTVVASGVLVGVCLWAAAAPSHADLPFGTLVASGLNLVPAAILVLAVGTLVLAIRPRWTVPVTYGLVAYSFVVELVGALVHAPRSLLDTSLLHHVSLAPARPVDLRTELVLLALAGGTFAAAVRPFGTRDLVGA